ncbi:hypothetical protein LEMLEM_LOCUS26297 [Lemmus lemmus]
MYLLNTWWNFYYMLGPRGMPVFSLCKHRYLDQWIPRHLSEEQ